jgi:Domain of unknown function (DUF4157)
MTFAPKTAKQQGAENQSHKNAFFSAPFIQRKLTVNEPGDAYEQEADAVADKVMRMQDPLMPMASSRQGGTVSQPINRVSISSLQRKCATCEEDDTMQRKEAGNTGGGMSAPPIVSDVLSGSGKPLDKGTQQFMESRMGQDFSNVRIHTEGKAAESAQSVNALAYTSGHNIVFNNGQYQPNTEGGKRLLAHELVHVGQQNGIKNTIQRMKLTQHAFTKGDCGERNVQWIFSLDTSAPEDGYIVQNVKSTENIKKCPDLAKGASTPNLNFWEAWFVKKGDKVDWTTTRDGWTDGSTRGPEPTSNGNQVSAGTIKFFTKKITGDLGDFNVSPSDPKSSWGPGKVPRSGALPSTPTQPSWWTNTPTEGPVNRSASSTWNCCDKDKSKHTNNIKAVP